MTEDSSPFARVPAPLRAALEARGFTSLTAVQQAALDACEVSRDLRISSQTGSGKTVALGLAIAPSLLAEDPADRTGPEALVIVPTRELAAQVRNELDWLYDRVETVWTDVVTGGVPVVPERRRLTRRPRVLVGTPGRLVDHLRTGALVLGHVRELVLDEADQMLDMGFREDLENLLGAMPRQGRRTHLVSATFSDAVLHLAADFQDDVLHVEGTAAGLANADIEHVAHLVRGHDRYAAMVNTLLMEGPRRRVLVFVATRAATATLAEQLSADGFPALPLSGELAQAQRTRTLEAFRAGTARVLIATDVAARGLDVPDVSTVIHADLPFDAEVYTHRSGRTGRAGKRGRSVLLATPNNQRRAARILDQAHVDVAWQKVPDVDQVERAVEGRLRKQAERAIAHHVTEGLAPEDLEFAQVLVAAQDPVDVVAALLAARRVAQGGRPPFEVESLDPRGSGRRSPRDDRGSRDDGGRAPGPRREPRGQRDRGAEPGFTRFRITWGFRQGANPRRILAAVCRRGEVGGRMIGSIEIAPNESTFDVSNEVAEAFEQAARQPDERDRKQRIERLDPPRD